MTTRDTSSKHVTAHAKAFSCEPAHSYRFLADDRGILYAWDDVAQHYTRCLSLTPGDERRIRHLADHATTITYYDAMGDADEPLTVTVSNASGEVLSIVRPDGSSLGVHMFTWQQVAEMQLLARESDIVAVGDLS